MPKFGEHKVNSIDSFYRQRPSKTSVREGETISFLENGRLIKQEKRNGVIYEVILSEAAAASTLSEDIAEADITAVLAGTGLSGGGTSGDVTLSIDSTVATLTGTQTLTNKTISGSSNTLTNIGNSSLTNSSITVTAGSGLTDGGSVSLGSSTTLNVGAGTGITVNADDIAVDTATIFASPTFTGTTNAANLTLSGNLIVNGTTITIDTDTLAVQDPLIKLAKSNSASDTVDIGFYGLYDTSGSQDLYAGLFRDADDSGKFKLFKDLQTEPTSTVNVLGTGYTTGTLVASLEGNASTATALETARTFTLTGEITAGGVSFDGTGNVSLSTAISAGVIEDGDIASDAAITITKLADYTISGVSLGGTLGALTLSSPLSFTSGTSYTGAAARNIELDVASINHDALANYVANEHIDWTAASAGTIHSSNYTDTSQATTFVIQDSGTPSNVTISQGKYVKFQALNNGGLDIQWGSPLGAGNSGDPYDLQFQIDLGDLPAMAGSLSGTDNIAVYDSVEGTVLVTAQEIADLSSGGLTYNGSTANGVLTYGSSTTIDVESQLTFSGGLLDISGTSYSILRLNETDVTNNPSWWTVADGGNYSIRLNNTGTYPFSITTNATNNAVDSITLGYNTSILGNLTLNNSLTIGSGGNYAAGSIYSDSNWGMLFRAKQASPTLAEFRWANSADSELMRIDTSGNLKLPSDNQKLIIGANSDLELYAHDPAGDSRINVNNNPLLITYNGADRFRLSSGDLVINEGGGDYNFRVEGDTDPNLFFVDGSADRVGIGTSSPLGKLHIESGTSTDTALLLKVQYDSSGGDRGKIQWRDGANITGSIHTEFDGTDVSMHFGSLYNSGYNTTTRMTLTGQGQLGIGTASPSAKLHVAEGFAYIYQTDSPGKLELRDSRASYDAEISQRSDGRISLATRAGTYGSNGSIEILDSGNVGIGTTSPTNFGAGFTNLQISGSTAGSVQTTDSTNSATAELFTSGGVGYVGTRSNHSFRIKSNDTTAMTIDTSQNVGIGTTNLGTNYKMIVKRTTNCNLGVGLQGGELSLEAFNDAITASVPFRLYGSEFNMLGGNVGIGTESPDSKLQVEYTTTSNGTAAIAEFGTSGSGAIANSGHQVIIGGPSVGGYTGLLIYSDSISGNGQISFADGRGANDSWRGTIVYEHSTDAMEFWTNATEKMKIDSSGRLLIGDTSVHYSGTDLQVGNTSDSQNGIQIQTSTTGNGYVLFGDGTGASAYRGQVRYDHTNDSLNLSAGGSETVYVKGGNVSIGVISPSAKLHVGGDAFFNGQLRGGFGAVTTGGTADWNHSTNARSGNGYSLLLSTATNGPGTTVANTLNTSYYHILNFEYASYDGDANMTQIGIPYYFTNLDGVRPVIRSRYSGTWSQWHSIPIANQNGSIQGSKGSASNPSYVFNQGSEISEPDTGMFCPGANMIGFSTAGTEKVRIDSSGRLLVGTTATGFDGDADMAIFGTGSGSRGITIYAGSTSNSQINFADSNSGAGRYTGIIRYSHSINAMSFYTNDGVEAVRIDSTQDAHFDQDVIAFSSTPSDIRLKKNFTKIENGLDIVTQLEGHTFNWKKGGDRLSAGFKAQEVEKILPHLVDEKKLPLRADDDKEYKILRYEEMIPYLVEAIKEQQQQINELKEKLNG